MSMNDEMVDGLVVRRLLRTPRVIEAFRAVDRGHFCPGHSCYADSPQPIGHGQTISAPHMVAIMTEAAQVSPGMSVLEIGAGSGYQAAILGVLAAPATVHTVEYLAPLATVARVNIARAGVGNVAVHEGDGSLGLPALAPFDRIVVTCAAPDIPPPLIDQIADGGSLLIPVGRGLQDLLRVTRKGDRFRRQDLGGCVFVPLRGEHGFDMPKRP